MKLIDYMFKKGFKLTHVVIFSFTASLMAVIMSSTVKDEIRSEGFFSLYQGPFYTAYGRPFWIIRCYEGKFCKMDFAYILLNLFIFFIIFFILFLSFGFFISLYKKYLKK